MIPNLFELDELIFLKRQRHPWRRFKEKQKYLPSMRSITYQCQQIMSKLFVFELQTNKIGKKIKPFLTMITEKQILGLDGLYQIMNESMHHHEFSQEVQKIKKFQKDVEKHISGLIGKDLITFTKSNFLNFHVYKNNSQFYVKASFNHYHYQILISFSPVLTKRPQYFKITNPLVKKELIKRQKILQCMLSSIPLDQQATRIYKNFYDSTYFRYDEYILKLQIYQNYPLLRMKNYMPIHFRDYNTKVPLEGAIFSNADPECMFAHFTGYNADSTKFMEGIACQICQIQVDQLQENQLLMMLRDNVANPQKQDIFFCPQYNRFKIIRQSRKEDEQQQDKYQTVLKYLNYYHFRINLKKISNKNRLNFYPKSTEENFPLTFNFLGRDILIMDPARGKYCQHYTFTDLRRYYMSYDPLTNLYSCPIEGCGQTMADTDIIYLKEVSIILDYIKFKCDNSLDYINCAKVVIDHKNKKVYAAYKIKLEDNNTEKKQDELIDFYKSLIDPFIPFADYSLGIKSKQKQRKMNEYMFGGLREEAQDNDDQIQQDSQEQDKIYEN